MGQPPFCDLVITSRARCYGSIQRIRFESQPSDCLCPTWVATRDVTRLRPQGGVGALQGLTRWSCPNLRIQCCLLCREINRKETWPVNTRYQGLPPQRPGTGNPEPLAPLFFGCKCSARSVAPLEKASAGYFAQDPFHRQIDTDQLWQLYGQKPKTHQNAGMPPWAARHAARTDVRLSMPAGCMGGCVFCPKRIQRPLGLRT